MSGESIFASPNYLYVLVCGARRSDGCSRQIVPVRFTDEVITPETSKPIGKYFLFNFFYTVDKKCNKNIDLLYKM